MSPNTWSYAAFLGLSAIFHLVAPRAAAPYLLLALSVGFYAWADPSGAPFIVGSILVVHAIARLMQGEGRSARMWLVVGVSLSIGMLAYFKYRGLLVDALGGFVGASSNTDGTPASYAPLGISFFTFLLVHYLVEVSRGRFKAARLRDLGLFVLFFPTIVAGPIRRFDQFGPQIHAARRPDGADVHEGLGRIVIGLAKKTLVADQIAPLSSAVFASHPRYSWAALWLAVYGYSLQIYFDFAGYSDMAIGGARLLGFRVPENFDYPYFRTNIAQFWRSWHMTLTGWIRDYVYIPLGGNRHGEARSNLNRLIAMTLCGLWHGSAFHFAVWGAYHGALLNLYHVWVRIRGRLFPARPQGSGHLLARVASTLLTFHLVAIGWVFFTNDVDQALVIVGRLLGLAA